MNGKNVFFFKKVVFQPSLWGIVEFSILIFSPGKMEGLIYYIYIYILRKEWTQGFYSLSASSKKAVILVRVSKNVI